LTKETTIKAINDLPEQFDLDILIEKLIFIDKVDKGLEQSTNGNVVSHEEVNTKHGSIYRSGFKNRSR
jgi:predicted transcriptional regulator